MFNVAICDDEMSICSQLENTILQFSKKTCLSVEVEVFSTGEELCNFIIKEHMFDLIFLDIEMGVMNGVEVGKRIRNDMKDHKTEIVFISGKDEYDRQLFDVQPLHFIPKPINLNTVIDDLKLAMLRADKNGGSYKYKKGADSYKIPLKDIIYFESLNREIKIVTTTGEDTFYGAIEEVFTNVAQHQCLRIHRSYIINYIHAVSFKYDEVIMSNGIILPISQSRRKEIREIQMGME